MEKNKDRRVRKSKEALKSSLIELMSQKPVNNITVKELVTAADLNRSTFYNYYSDIPDMLQKLEEELYNEFLYTLKLHIPENGITSNISTEGLAFIVDMCNVIKNNYEFCKSIFSKNGDMNFLFKLEEMVETNLKGQLGGKFNSNITYITYVYSFFKSGYIGILKNWMKGGCKESSEEIAYLTYSLLKSVVDTCKLEIK